MKSIDKNFSNTRALIRLEVEPNDHGLRLDEACKLYLKSQSRQVVKKMISNKQIKICNRPTKNAAHTIVKHMDIVEVFRENFASNNLNLNVIYKDEYLIAVSKPKGMPVHPTGIHHFDVASVLVEQMLDEKIYPVHRLDIKTSGVLLFARSVDVAQKMREIFDNKLITKQYGFIGQITDNFKGLPQELNLALNYDEASELSLKQKVDSSGKESCTFFEEQRRDKNYLYGIATPRTGRLHQIRCHLAHIGLPIVGDDIYGGYQKEDELMLHCMGLEFIHPITKSKLQIQG